MIDGQEIDRHHGEWLHLWNELSQKVGHREAYAEMVGNVPKLTQIVTAKGDGTKQTLVDGYTLHIPLQFWFCRNPGLSIPLVALKNSEVSIDLEFEEFNNLIWGSQETPDGTDKGFISMNGWNNSGYPLWKDYNFETTMTAEQINESQNISTQMNNALQDFHKLKMKEEENLEKCFDKYNKLGGKYKTKQKYVSLSQPKN